MTNKETGSYILKKLLAEGADKADCDVNTSRVDELNIENGEINLLRTMFNTNISMKAIKNRKSGIVKINSSDKDTLNKAVRDCMEATTISMVEEAEDIAELTENRVIGSEADVDLEMLHFRLKELIEESKKRYPQIIFNEIHAAFTSGSRVHMNTNGVEMEERYHKYDMYIGFSAQDNQVTSSITEYSFAVENLDTPLLENGILPKLFEQTEKSIYPKPLEGKFEGTVILMPDVFNQLLYSLQGLLLSDKALIDGTSQWKDSLDKVVADSGFTLSSIYSDKEMVTAGALITEDGYFVGDMNIIDKGVLISFLLSRFGSRKTGIPRSKNYGGAFVVEPGDRSFQEIIASIDRGILIGALSGNQPEASGEVTGVAKTSFLIEKGELKGAINETMISCNLLDMLRNIRGISKEQICNGYYKLPYIAFDGVVISGK